MSSQALSIPENIRMVRLAEDSLVPPFESEDRDLNDFLLKDAKNYLAALLSVTYLLKAGNETIAYFSLSNDSLIKNDGEKSVWNKETSKNPKLCATLFRQNAHLLCSLVTQ